ncbi:MAG: ComEC/Rec2 family competence protein, partial [Solirubrobacteraceae bacterium]
MTAAALGEALTRARAHPRHVGLAAVVAGLLAWPWPAVVLALALVAALLGGRRALALGALAGVLAGAWAGTARTAALDRTHLGPLLGRTGDLRLTLLERARPRRSGAQMALAAIVSGPGRGERVALRSGPHVSWPRAAVGAELVVRGRLVGLSAREGYLRRRNAHAVILASAITAPGARRGGLAGALDRVRARAERGVSSGLDPPRAALARGMVLGQDEALSEGTRDEFRDSGLAHLLAASGQNVMLLAALALPALALLGCGLRARLGATLVLVAIYVPLAGAGPSIQRAGIMGAAGLIAGLAGRPTQRWYAVLLAAAVTLMINPCSAQDPGWQLSFAAISGIGLLAPRLRGGLAARRVPPAL